MAERLTLSEEQVNEAFTGIVARDVDEVREAFDAITDHQQSIVVYVNSSNSRRRRKRLSGEAIVANTSRYFRRRFDKLLEENPNHLTTADRREVSGIANAINTIQIYVQGTPLSEGAREIIAERDLSIPHTNPALQERIIRPKKNR